MASTLATLSVAVLPAQVAGASPPISVTTCNDNGPGSLRAAVSGASSGDSIIFSLSCTPIALTSGPIDITTDLTITGPGSSALAVSGTGHSQVFDVSTGVTVSISSLTIEDGYNAGGCPVGCQASGGGIENDGTLMLTDMIVTGNEVLDGCNASCGAFGGGIENDATGTLTLTDTTVSDNTAYGSCGSACSGMGGGIVNYGALTVTNSTVTDNLAFSGCGSNCGASGGGIENEAGGTATVTDSTFTDNSAILGCMDQCGASGGGIDNAGMLTATSSALSTNSVGAYCVSQCAPFGGGIANEATGTLTLTSSTLTANSAATGCASGCNLMGGGLYNDGTASVEGTTLVESGAIGGDCFLATPLIDLGNNVDDDGTCAFLPEGGSQVHAVIEVETSPAYAGDAVTISSTQLQIACGGKFIFETLQDGGSTTAPRRRTNAITVVLDDDGNVTVVVDGANCAPGSDLIEADMPKAPYLTATTTLVVDPPQVVTPSGVSAFPANEVETGDTTTSGFSDVYTVFYVDTDPVYAEQPVEISSPELEDRCGGGWRFEPSGGTAISQASGTTVATGTLDDDGNATFVFKGVSCAPGTSTVTADVDAGTHTTYTTIFTIDPPKVTLSSTRLAASATKHRRRHHHGPTTTPPDPPAMTVTASPNPLVETGGENIAPVASSVDLSITKTDNEGGETFVGDASFYWTVTVTNSGSLDANGVVVSDPISTITPLGDITSDSWHGDSNSGNGDLSDTADIPANSSVTYYVYPVFGCGAEVGDQLTNTATFTYGTDTGSASDTATIENNGC